MTPIPCISNSALSGLPKLDLDENTLFDLDAYGNICGITVEHAKERAEKPSFSYEQIAA